MCTFFILSYFDTVKYNYNTLHNLCNVLYILNNEISYYLYTNYTFQNNKYYMFTEKGKHIILTSILNTM